jgi:hypothetical protein
MFVLPIITGRVQLEDIGDCIMLHTTSLEGTDAFNVKVTQIGTTTATNNFSRKVSVTGSVICTICYDTNEY